MITDRQLITINKCILALTETTLAEAFSGRKFLETTDILADVVPIVHLGALKFTQGMDLDPEMAQAITLNVIGGLCHRFSGIIMRQHGCATEVFDPAEVPPGVLCPKLDPNRN